MKTLGIVGGIGPESTIDYYRFILDGCRARIGNGPVPHLIIDSIDVNRGIAMLDANDLSGLTNYVSASVERLARAGADLALIAANTPHIVFNEVQRQVSLPMLSMVQATCDHAENLGFKRLGLIGTGFTMRAQFYQQAFARRGIDLVTPDQADRELIHDKYINELLKNRFLPETRSAISAILERMRSENGVEAVVLAGTELPLLLRSSEPAEIRFLDTTLIHVSAAVDAILS